MIAVIKTGGKQYLVKEGDALQVEKIEGEAGAKLSFDTLLIADGDKVTVGAPSLGEKVKAEIVIQGRAPKVSVVKYKAKSRYTRRVGHRQMFTLIKITNIA